MKLKSIAAVIAIGQLGMLLPSHNVYAHSHEQNTEETAAVEAEVEKGPNNGRMLRDRGFAIELAIFETGVPPEFRVFASQDGQAIDPGEVEVNVKLSRLGDGIDDIQFFVEKDYQRGNLEIYEPHSFAVTLTARYQGKTHSWTYDNFEGRTAISNELAQAMEIETEVVASREMEERLKVYGELTLPANANRNISARFPGQITALNVGLGQRVEKGQVLMTIEANESLQKYQVRSPIDGVITAQNAGSGEQTQGRVLLTVTDSSKLLANIDVYPMDVSKVKLGAPVDLHIPGVEQPIAATLSDSLLALTERQAKVYRARVDNTDGSLRPGQFLTAQVLVDTYGVERAVKVSGLQAFRDFTVVYGKFGEQYEVRMLELGRQSGDWVEVLSGIPVGTEYVTSNSYIIKADIEKSGASHDH